MKNFFTKIGLCVILLFPAFALRPQEPPKVTLNGSSVTQDFICNHKLHNFISEKNKASLSSKTLPNKGIVNSGIKGIGLQPAVGDKNVLIIRANFSGPGTVGNVGQRFTRRQTDIGMAALDAYVRKISYNKLRVTNYELTPPLQSDKTPDEIKGDLGNIAKEMKELAKKAGYTVDNRIVYLVFDGYLNIQTPGGAWGSGNGTNGTVWWSAALGDMKSHVYGFVHEGLHALGMGHNCIHETKDQNSYQGSNVPDGVDPYHYMGTTGISGSRYLDLTNVRDFFGKGPQLPIGNKIRFGWVSKDNLHIIPGRKRQKIRFDLSDGTQANLENKRIGVVINGYPKTFTLGYYKNVKTKDDDPEKDRVDHRGGVLVHEFNQRGMAQTYLLDAHPNSVDGSPDPKRQTLSWQRVFEFGDAPIRVGETMKIGDWFSIRVDKEGGVENNRWVEVSIIPQNLLVTIPVGEQIALRGNNGKYVSSENEDMTIFCNKSEIGNSEWFTVVDAGDNIISLQASSGKYIGCHYWDEDAALFAERDIFGLQERLWWENHNGKIALKAYNKKYLSSENGEEPMRGKSDQIGSWELFDVKIKLDCNFENIPGEALDIGAGGHSVFIVGTNNHVYRRNGNTWLKIASTPLAKRIDVTESGIPWIISTKNEIYKWNEDKNKFDPFWGIGTDIGISRNVIIVVGTDGVLYKAKQNGGWESLPHSKSPAVRVDVAANGYPWIVGKDGYVYQYQGRWTAKKGDYKARDISIQPTGSKLWTANQPTGAVHFYKGGHVWKSYGGIARNITLNSDGSIWLTDDSNHIFNMGCNDFYGFDTAAAKSLLLLGSEESQTIQSYPNPASDFLIIDGLAQQDFVTLFDLKGRVIQRVQAISSSVKFDFSELESGMYIIKKSSYHKSLTIIKK